MTLPASFPLSMSQIAVELGRSLPISLRDPWVIALAQVAPAAPVSFSNLLGKSGRFDGSVLATSGGGVASIPLTAPFFGGVIQSVSSAPSPINQTQVIFFSQSQGGLPPNWSGNILVKNNTNAVSVVLPKIDARTWGISASVGGLIRAGFTDSFTILPSN